MLDHVAGYLNLTAAAQIGAKRNGGGAEGVRRCHIYRRRSIETAVTPAIRPENPPSQGTSLHCKSHCGCLEPMETTESSEPQQEGATTSPLIGFPRTVGVQASAMKG